MKKKINGLNGQDQAQPKNDQHDISVIKFEGVKIRIVKINGEPWFVASDACEALETENPTKAVKVLDVDENTLTSIQGIRGNPNRGAVSESGFYKMVHQLLSLHRTQNNLLKNKVGHFAGKEGNSATGNTAVFRGCLLVAIVNDAVQEKKKGEYSAPAFWLWASVDHCDDLLRACRFLSARNTLSGRYPAGLFSGSDDGCVLRFFIMRQSFVTGFGFLPKFLFLRLRASNSIQNRIGFFSRSVSDCPSGAGVSCLFDIYQPLGSDLDLRRCSSSRATLTSCRISSPAFVPISSTRANASREVSNGFPLLSSAWRRAISPRTAVTMNCAFVSSFSSEFSMSRTTSCGNLAPICCDLLLVELVDISHPLKKCDIHNTIKVNRTKDLSCGSPYFMVNFTLSLWEAKMTKPAGATNTNGPLTTTVNVDNEAAMKNSITHPQGRDSHNPKKFTWRFLALSTAKPRQITIEATTEREARQQSPAGFVMVFAGRLPVQEASHE